MADKDEIHDLKALKPLKYATRRLLPGDTFASKKPLMRKFFIATKQAVPYRVPGTVEAPSPELSAKIERQQAHRDATYAPVPSPVPAKDAEPADERPALRKAYFEKFGKRALNFWTVEQLREKLAAPAE